MEALYNIQEDIKSKIARARTNFKKSPKERITSSYIETRLEKLEQQWQMFDSTHIKIISSIQKAELRGADYFKNDVYDAVEDLYIEFKSDMKEMLTNLKVTVDSQKVGTDAEVTRIRLPEVKIPVFSGKYSEWQTFKDLFVSLIHNNKGLDDAQKLYYLKGHLSGEAQRLLNNIYITADNYRSSWAKLESMYNNKRFLANGILKRLLNQKSLAMESAVEIKELICTTTECLEALKNLGVEVASWDILIIHLISAKLDRETRKTWELHIASVPGDDLPKFSEFVEFLTGRFRGLENIDTKSNISRSSRSFHVVEKDRNQITCDYCSGHHRLTICKGFTKESNHTRRNFVQENGLCFICLANNHLAKHCRNAVKCHVCKKRHHTLLHPSGGTGSVGKNSGEVLVNGLSTPADKKNLVEATSVGEHKAALQADGSNKRVLSCHSAGMCTNTVLIPTALVEAESKHGVYRLVRALIDQGSQGSFITEAMAQYLGLKKASTKHLVMGVGGSKAVISKSMVAVKIRSRVDPGFSIHVNAYVLKSITSLLPVAKANRVEWDKLNNFELADSEYHRPNKIDVLLGAEVYSQIIRNGIKKSGSLLAQDTTLGWIVSGPTELNNTNKVSAYSCITVMQTSVQKDDDLLRKFWELEAEPTENKQILTQEEIECERLFVATTKRDAYGRYIVRLPFRDSIHNSRENDSKLIALKRFENLEIKLAKNIKLKQDYTKVIHEYIELNHMVKVSEEKQNEGLYLPHHAVIREDKQTTKVRVVFDASCKGRNGTSLNDHLMVGPILQDDLRSIVMRWRRHPICLCADIIKMYRQVLVSRDDTKYQRILWRDSPEQDLEELELITVTFGTASAPFLAVRALHQVANDEGQDSPMVSEIIRKDFYMDDLMTGAENLEQAHQIYLDIKNILSKGGFQMQKWISNNKDLVTKIKEGSYNNNEEMEIKIDNITKILGLTWDPQADVFQYSVEPFSPKEPVTKRKIISDISRLFDPLGWLAPCIILAKIIIQKLWLAGIGWDQEVPSILVNEWKAYRNDLSCLVNIKIPRWYNMRSTDVKVQLHGFSDASKLAYSAVIYMRVVDADGHIRVTLVTSKTKVAPIKQVSIPRLELCGAVLLAKLLLEVARVLDIEQGNLYAWTDSEVVLAWLNCHPSRWKTFVGNRVAEILNILDTKHWSYVQSKQNPADCASRGVAPRELGNTSIWFNGPEFLNQPIIEFHKPKHLVTKLEEIKVHSSTVTDAFWYRFSSLQRMVRVIAYCRRFLNYRKKGIRGYGGSYLSSKELDEALAICIRKSQEEEVSGELEELKKNGCLASKKNKYKSLNLFLDSREIIRVGGRLEMSNLRYNRKHPILIPKDSFLTKLLIAEAHKRTMHGGPQAMITYLRSNYWIVGIKVLVKAHFRKCVICLRYSDKARTQLMGQLPSPRVTPNKVFLISGVDYAGPINIRVSKGRGNKSYKGYIALFICMSTRAIHLEVVSDMSSKGFLAAFKRFVARRGRCVELHSDNGTNFVGAARELQELFKEEKSKFLSEIAEDLANNGVQWKFIPPHAPNFGGLWEAGIKSTKYHLRRVIGNSTLTYEELSTVLTQIEACLNSRPLSYVEEQSELIMLTPGHFLVGESLVSVPDKNYEGSNITNLRRWQLTQRMVQDFWRQWSQDYLHQFLQRHRWAYQTPEPAVGDVVLVKEDELPPGKWLLGRIEQKHPGSDGITRVVTIRTKNSLIKRPVSKLCLLPVTV